MSPIIASPRPTDQESTTEEMIPQTPYSQPTTHQELKTKDTTLQGTISKETVSKDMMKTSGTTSKTKGRLKFHFV